MRRTVALFAALSLCTTPAAAQTLREDIESLFSFGACGQPLCLSLSGPADRHGGHYISSSVQANGSLLGFLNGAIGATLGSIPISATSSGATFRFVNGAPVSTATSAGPIFAERAQTLGRGGLLIGVNSTRLAFNRLRGTDLDDVSFNFAHQDIAAPGLGDLVWEREVINVRPSIRLTHQSTALFATYGVTDRFDVGVAVPIVYASMRGSSTAQVLDPGGALSGLHYFGSDTLNRAFSTSARASGSHTGIGDVAVRAKASLTETDRIGVSVMADGRLPTGDEDNFTGTGHLALRALGIVSARFGSFSPHLNGGYAYRTGDLQNDAVLLTAGFDQLLTPAITLAVDAISEFQVGASELTLPQTIQFTSASTRSVAATNIPDRRDDIVNLSVGAKFAFSRITAVANGILPLGSGGMQARGGIYTLGLERTFR
jgi:hypothetical protein